MEYEQAEQYPFTAYQARNIDMADMKAESAAFLKVMTARRSIREFSDEPISPEVIENLVKTACTAPSGANKQPWTFCIVSDPELKRKIREAAEHEEYVNYHGRMSDEWKDDLKPFATDWYKPFLTTAPYLIVVFKQTYELRDGKKHNNYYVSESVGIAVGMLLSAIEHTGLVALTHTPSPMNFLRDLLGRPENEKAFLLIPVGRPAQNCAVPVLKKKAFSEVVHCY